MTSIQDVILENKLNGHFFFSPATMRFFNSKVESGLLHARYFITSERPEKHEPKQFSIREVKENFGIETVGRFRQFKSKAEAIKFLDNYLLTLKA